MGQRNNYVAPTRRPETLVVFRRPKHDAQPISGLRLADEELQTTCVIPGKRNFWESCRASVLSQKRKQIILPTITIRQIKKEIGWTSSIEIYFAMTNDSC